PDQVSPAALDSVDLVVAVGQAPEETVGRFCKVLGLPPPGPPSRAPREGEVVLWSRHGAEAPYPVRLVPSHVERRRHTRKYAEGELPPDRSFYFQGPEGKLNLRAQNLILFLQIADGVDDDTWEFHLRRGDYSQWFRERIKDEALADEAAAVEGRQGLAPAESRRLIKEVVEKYYTLPSSAPLPGTDAAPAGG